jgi:hypothetical protein
LGYAEREGFFQVCPTDIRVVRFFDGRPSIDMSSWGALMRAVIAFGDTELLALCASYHCDHPEDDHFLDRLLLVGRVMAEDVESLNENMDFVLRYVNHEFGVLPSRADLREILRSRRPDDECDVFQVRGGSEAVGVCLARDGSVIILGGPGEEINLSLRDNRLRRSSRWMTIFATRKLYCV